jgi:hypothetical protein
MAKLASVLKIFNVSSHWRPEHLACPLFVRPAACLLFSGAGFPDRIAEADMRVKFEFRIVL